MEAGILEVVTGLLVAGLGALAAWVVRMNARVAVLEHALGQLPKELKGISDELKGLREDANKRANKLYEHIDGVRKEVDRKLDTKADKSRGSHAHLTE